MKNLKAASDTTFLIIVMMLTIGGFFIFVSASLGLLARGSVSLSSVVFNQLILGVVGGLIALYCALRTNYLVWKDYAPHVFAFAVFLTALVFVPHVGFSTKGASRWILVGPFTFQPSELLKLATIILTAWYIQFAGKKLRETTLWSLGGIGAILFFPGLLLVMQPDIDVLVIISLTVSVMFFCSGMRMRDIAVCILVACIALAGVVYMKPHVQQRIKTFIHPELNVRGSGYQIRQSTIAVGSGGMLGRGFGQSVQKFGYLPEPIGDSVFAVFAEEFGFAGCLILLATFMFFALKGFFIAAGARDLFGSLLAFGIVFMITLQSLMNIGSLLSLLPLSGNPLVFVSHGGTALMIALLSTGIVLNISKHKRLPGKV